MRGRLYPLTLLACISFDVVWAVPAVGEELETHAAAETGATLADGQRDPADPAIPVAATTEPPALRLGPPTDRAAYGRAALETLILLGIGTGQYWLSAPSNTRDWDFPRWSERLSEANVRFDNNTHATNNLLHPLAGAAYYGFSRANGLSVGESVLYAQVASALWELGLEWREKVSVNDMIVTTAGGTGVGEFFVQLAAYLNSAPDGGAWPQDVAAATLGFPVWVHDELDDRGADPGPAKDRLGFSSAYHHRFTLDIQNDWVDDAADLEQQLLGVGLSAQLSSLLGLLEPKTFAVPFYQGNFTEAELDLQFDHEGLAAVDVKFDSVLAGYYAQWMSGPITGLMAGVGTGLQFVDRSTVAGGDQYALAHCVGPTLAFFWKSKSIGVALTSRLYGDFAAIRSLAWPAVHSGAPGAVYKSTLARGYQYNLGLSNRSTLDVRFHALLLSGEFAWGRYGSIEGLDRFQEQITRDLEGTETLDERRVTLALEPPGTLLRAFVGVERSSHVSQLGPESGGRLERRFVAGAGLAF